MTFIRSLILSLCSLLLLTACGGIISVEIDRPEAAQSTVEALQTQVAVLQSQGPLLSLQSDSETIRQALLNSHRRWNRMWVSGFVTEYTGDTSADSQTTMFQAWIDQPNARFRLLQGQAKDAPELALISDGSSITRIQLRSETIEQTDLSESAHAPFTPPALPGDTIIRHPLISLMDSAAQPVFYPGDLAQRGGEFRALEVTALAGRPALVVEWQHDGQALDVERQHDGQAQDRLWVDSETDQVLDRLWVDSETGHLLRWQSHGMGETYVVVDILLNMISYDPPFSNRLFDPDLSEAPEYISQAGQLPTPEPETPPSSFSPGEGQLYFVDKADISGPKMMRLPTSCVTGQALCEKPDPVPGYPNQSSSFEPLYWSPDGTLAAVIIYDPMKALQTLWLYRPADQTWTAMGRYPTLHGPVVWSPDSYWLSFTGTIQPNGPEILFATSRDGERNYDLTGGVLSKDDSQIHPVAWINNQTVLFLFVDQNAVQLYTARPDKSRPEQLNTPSLPAGLGVAALSPDRTRLAFSVQGDQGASALWLANMNGTNATLLYTGQNTPLQQIAWSADGSRLAFVTLNNSESTTGVPAATAAVYIANNDGRNRREVYQSPSLGRMAFAPDAPFLVVEDHQNDQLVVVPVDGTPPSILSIPGLQPDAHLLGISWRVPR